MCIHTSNGKYEYELEILIEMRRGMGKAMVCMYSQWKRMELELKYHQVCVFYLLRLNGWKVAHYD